MLPAYDKQSGTLLDVPDEADDDDDDGAPAALLLLVADADVAAVAPDDDDVAAAAADADDDLVVNASGMTPRQRGMQALMTPRRLQHGLWSRPPAAQRARIAKD